MIPTHSPTYRPTSSPTESPTYHPTYRPTDSPTDNPTDSPSYHPTDSPTDSPTYRPTDSPTGSPTRIPTLTPTSTPTNVPTSYPSANPTSKDPIAANLLDTPMTSAVVKAKTRYYLGFFVGYFISFYICLYLYSFTNYGKGRARQLYDSAYQSQRYVQQVNAISSNSSDGIKTLADVHRMSAHVQNALNCEVSLKQGDHGDMSDANTPDTLVSSNKLLDNMLKYNNVYTNSYREYFNQKFTIIGCAPIMYPNGYTLRFPCFHTASIVLPPGRYEDILLYLYHNHPLLSCWYFMPGSKLGAHGTRILYIGVATTIFLLYQFSSMLLEYYSLNQLGLGTVINMFIITPLTVSVGLLLRYLWLCPFTETIEFKRKYAGYESLILFVGRLAIVPLLFLMASSLVLACLLSSDRMVAMTLINFFVYIQFYGMLLSMIKMLLLFVDRYYYRVDVSLGVLAIEVVCIGKLYKERIVSEGLTIDVDFACKSYTVFGVVRIQRILNREDAIKAKWIVPSDEHRGKSSITTTRAVLELGEIHSNTSSSKKADVATQNPLLVAADASAAVNDTAVEQHDEVSYDIYNTYSDDTLSTTISNCARSNTNNNSFKSNLYNSAVVEDDDDILQSEYRTQYLDRYDIDCDETLMTFEEWKIKRKEFKQGTHLRPRTIHGYHRFTHSSRLSS